MPSLPVGEPRADSNYYKSADDYYVGMFKTIADYANLNIREVLDLPCDYSMMLYKHAIVDDLMQTDEGRKILRKSANKGKCDIDTLHKLFG